MIREATINDVIECGKLAEEFYFARNKAGEFNSQCFIEFWGKILASGQGVIYLREVDGVPREAIGLIYHPNPYNGKPCASSMFWFVTESQGLASGALFEHVMGVVEKGGIMEFKIPLLLDERLVRIGSFLKSHEFDVSDLTYMKEIK